MAIKTEKITFPGSQGHLLFARLDTPEEPIKGYALFVHCFTCSSNVLAASHISSALTEKGIAVLRFDFTGLGSSEGEFSNTNFSSNVEDIKAAIAYLQSRNMAPQILVGHSLGGAAILHAAEEIPDHRLLVTINAPSEPSHIRNLLKNAVDEVVLQGHAKVVLEGRGFQINKQFIEDLEKHKGLDYLQNIKSSLLIFHSPQDRVVSIDNARQIFVAARHPKSFISLDGADHLLTRMEDAVFVADIIRSWVDRYLEAFKK